MRNYNGYIRLPRDIFCQMRGKDLIENVLYKDAISSQIYIFLVCHANWKDGNGAPIGWDKPLKKGQILTSVKEIASSLGLTTKPVLTRLNFLVRNGLITLDRKGAKHYRCGTIITVCNYDDYVCKEVEKAESGQDEGQDDGVQNGDSQKCQKKVDKKINKVNLEPTTVLPEINIIPPSSNPPSTPKPPKRSPKRKPALKVKNQKPILPSWDKTHRYCSVFDELKAIPVFMENFNDTEYCKHIDDLISRYGIDTDQLSMICYSLKLHAEVLTEPIKNWKLKLNTFVRNNTSSSRTPYKKPIKKGSKLPKAEDLVRL